jgi:hypothetical protein
LEKKRVERVLPGREGRVGRWPKKMCTHVSKCKNDKRKKKELKKYTF